MNYAEIIEQDRRTREQVTQQRHADDCYHAQLRAGFVAELQSDIRLDRDRGYLKVPENTLNHTAAVVEEGRRLRSIAAAAETEAPVAVKVRLVDRFVESADLLETALFQFALQPTLVNAIAKYLGYVPILATADYWWSPNLKSFSEYDSHRTLTQLSHLDWADNTVVKVFIHCASVTRDNGPLHLLDPQLSINLAERLGYRYAQKLHKNVGASQTDGIYISDSDMYANGVEMDGMTTLTGEKEQVYLADTARCFHFGGRNDQAQERLLGVLMYLRPGALKLATLYKESPPFAHLVSAEHDAITRLVLGGSV